jgi:acetate kinase
MNPRLTTDAESVVLALNAGGSSLKFALYTGEGGIHALCRGSVTDIADGTARLSFDRLDHESQRQVNDHAEAAAWALDTLIGNPATAPLVRDRLAATVHRVVHGGALFAGPTIVDERVLEQIASLASLAPLHNPPATAVMSLTRQRLPDLPMVALFDTSFFHTLPEHVRRYAVPAQWFEEHGVRRYGFHGLAHEYLRDRLRAHAGAHGMPPRAVTLQLGHGCSMTALRDGEPVETSMGFTPLEGLVMATRSGDIDAGALFELARAGHSPERLERELNHESGLRGLSGVSGDVRELLTLEAAGNAGAKLALRVFCHRIIKYLGAYAAVLGGLDAVAFGGGIGENAAPLRERICAGIAWLGLRLDPNANAACSGADAVISAPESRIAAMVVAVREDELMAGKALELIRQPHRAGTA